MRNLLETADQHNSKQRDRSDEKRMAMTSFAPEEFCWGEQIGVPRFTENLEFLPIPD